MKPGSASETTHIGIPEIAEAAGVGRNAVSNWRKRYGDFPEPTIETPSGVLFDLTEVERWLIEKGKISQRIPLAMFLWRSLDALRGDLDARDVGELVNAALVYLEVCARAKRREGRALAPGDSWREVRECEPREGLEHLRAAAARVEGDHPQLEGLIADGLRFKREPNPTLIMETISLLDLATDDEVTRVEMFEEARDRLHATARFAGEFATPSSLELLFARLVAGASTIFDPACGEGGSLLLASVIDGRTHEAPTLFGNEVNPEAWRIARTRFFLYGIDAEISHANSLKTQRFHSGVDAVILDPPYALRDWGDADDYVNDRWEFGTPPPRSADFAWLQLAIEPLNDTGRAFVLLPTTTLSRPGREQQIRARLIDSGAVEAIVLLPARLRRDISLPLALWCLRKPCAVSESPDLLLVDASRVGTASRSTISLDEQEVEAIATIVNGWANRRETVSTVGAISTVVVGRENLVEANLDPTRYQVAIKPDADELQAQVLSARQRVTEARARAEDAMARVLVDMEVK